MGRVSYELNDENIHRLDLLTAFGILQGDRPTREQLINESIQRYFEKVCGDYCDRADANDLLRRMMERALR